MKKALIGIVIVVVIIVAVILVNKRSQVPSRLMSEDTESVDSTDNPDVTDGTDATDGTDQINQTNNTNMANSNAPWSGTYKDSASGDTMEIVQVVHANSADKIDVTYAVSGGKTFPFVGQTPYAPSEYDLQTWGQPYDLQHMLLFVLGDSDLQKSFRQAKPMSSSAGSTYEFDGHLTKDGIDIIWHAKEPEYAHKKISFKRVK